MLWVKARAKDMLPIRPQYIRRMIKSLDNGTRSLVMPVVIPAVPMAEKVSNNVSDRDIGWTAIMIKDTLRAKNRLMVNTELACLMASSSSLLPNTLTP